MYGWTGKILEIDLTKGMSTVISLPIEIYTKFIGGKGLAGYFLRPHIHNSWNHPDMPLIFMTGPLVDTPAPTAGRMCISSKSPLTGTVGDTSVGGKLAVQLKRAGWDGIIIRGKSVTTCGISIVDEDVNFSNAGNLKGLKVSEMYDNLPLSSAKAVIGPAAENGVLFANIIIDKHFFAGRNGLGLVMAAKNLKFLCATGTGKTQIRNKPMVMKAREEIFRLAAASPMIKGDLGLSAYGTGALYDLMHNRRMMPTDNFRKTQFEKAPEMNAWAYKNAFEPKMGGCASCHILCKKKGKDGAIIPEFETMSHFSALIENDDINVVMEANEVCNEYGMDTITAAATLSCYAEVRNRKLKPSEVMGLLKKIALGQEIGNELKHGSKRFAMSLGKNETSMQVKGLELPAYDPRGAYGMALSYATSTRGACHLRAYPIAHEILRKPVATDRFSFSGKARIIKLNEDMNAAVDSLVACKFIFFGASLEEYAKALEGVTGIPCSAQDLIKTGERIYYQDRIMNSICGLSSKDDDLPDRFFECPGSGGDGIEAPKIDREEFLLTRGNYYKIRGLDDDGMPIPDKVFELGLEE